MCRRLLSLHSMLKLTRSSLLVSLLVLSSAYAMLGDELFRRIGAQIDRAGQRISDVTTNLGLRTAATSLEGSNESFEELLGYRETLNQQVRLVQEQRACAAVRIRQDNHLLQNILDVIRGNVITADGDLPRAVVEQDAAAVLRRVQAHESKIDKCNSLLRRMNEDLVKLEQEIENTHCSLRQRSDDLERQKATFAGQKAYRDGIDLARQLDDGDR